MKRLLKITAVTIVTALFISCFCLTGSAAKTYGLYGQGGFDPPFGWEYIRDNEIIFLPLGIDSNGIYKGYYILIPRDEGGIGRIIFTDDENNSEGKYGYYLQIGSAESSSASYQISTSLVSWRSNSRSTRVVTPTWREVRGLYYSCTLICYSDEMYIDYAVGDSNYHSYVVDSETDYDYIHNGYFNVGPGHGGVYIIQYPLVSTDSKWLYNYGYETEEQRKEAIEQSRFDEQNKIIKEGFTYLDNSINNMGNKIEGAITQAVDDILNAGSDMPTLDTNNEWMNDSLTKVNEWLSTLEEFDMQMDAAEEENAENMAQAKTFLTSFFSKIPEGIIAALTLALVMIVAVKAVGR